ncbi:MAG: Ig-like domain-containing protein [Prevotellaceae bacterium]|jgi:uncharacterized protein YjdB|nr:Ig-like domain-containing protein [Prevotellaceae bacterium]
MKHVKILAALALLLAVSCSKDEVTDITLDKTTLTLSVGATDTLRATVSPGSAANKTVKWSSSMPAIADVDNNGVVTAIAEGLLLPLPSLPAA